jgi:hypothetical protein
LNCPNCGSENTQTLLVIYESGTQDFNARSSSAGIFGGGSLGIGGGLTKTSGTTSTKFAQKAAPPSRKRLRWAILVTLFVPMYLGSFATVLGYAVFAVCAYWIYTIIKFNRNELPNLVSRWRNQWACHKCGSFFEQSNS